jgi:hypothetical protein
MSRELLPLPVPNVVLWLHDRGEGELRAQFAGKLQGGGAYGLNALPQSGQTVDSGHLGRYRKQLNSLVGGTGIEPVASTV